jgi:hypothetical protein
MQHTHTLLEVPIVAPCSAKILQLLITAALAAGVLLPMRTPGKRLLMLLRHHFPQLRLDHASQKLLKHLGQLQCWASIV